jgi:SAM-dependent methyltransferase
LQGSWSACEGPESVLTTSQARIAKAWLHAHAYRQAYGVDIDLDMLKLSKHAGQSEENVKIKLIYGGSSPASPTKEVRNGNGTTEYRDPTESDSDTTTDEEGDEEALDLDGMFRPRLTLLHSNVLDAKASPPTIPKVDIICALNYAVGYFHERSVLVKYLRLCRERLNKGGVMVTDLFGGDKSVEKRDGDVDSGRDEGIYSTEKDALSEPILVRKGEAYGGFGYYIKETPGE